MSIKWKLLFISILFVSIPTITMGIWGYVIFKKAAFLQAEQELSAITRDWQITSYSYIHQMERVLKREQVMAQQRLKTVVETCHKMLTAANAHHEKGLGQIEQVKTFKSFITIHLGKSGNVFLLDKNGNYLAFDPEGHRGKNFFHDLPEDSGGEIKGVLPSILQLKENESLVVNYNWRRPSDDGSKKVITAFSYFKPTGVIIAATTFYTDFQSMDLEKILQNELKYKLANTVIGKNGNFWVINSHGYFVVSRKGLQNGEYVFDIDDKNGQSIKKPIVDKTVSLGRDSIQTFYYSWKYLGEERVHEKVAATTYIPDWDWVLAASTEVDEVMEGPREVQKLLLIVCPVAIIIGSLVAYFFTLSLSGPLRRLTSISLDASKGNLNQDLSKIVKRQDEIGTLAQAFQQMIINLKQKINDIEKSHADLAEGNSQLVIEINERKKVEKEREELTGKLVEASRYAGMAEVATGVLHNVGNVLNSVNVSSNCLQEQLTEMKIENVARAMEQLSQHKDHLQEYLVNDPQGKNFFPFMDKLAEILLSSKQKMEKELSHLSGNVDHVKEIVSAQQSYARQVAVVDDFSVIEVFEDALKINLAGLTRHQVSIRKQFEIRPEIVGDRQKLLQILVNLIGNAKYAMDELNTERILTLKVHTKPGDTNLFYIVVSDNGKGIPIENLAKVFQHGFTTRRGGHGFGLHSSSLSAKQLGGNLWAESGGPGKGATFILELPLKKI
ncbi:MAG: cache domain-containing protein [Pseudomonadota bacterium]